ncbi:MAG TPA: hypothetical protein PKK31_09655 [Elusimicrobiales bacterium]|nr:hypothetical protein [Elusimicrobiales bacterium]
MNFSNTQVDKLGENLRKGVTVDILRKTDAYTRSFDNVYSKITEQISSRLKLNYTGRPVKSTKSLIEKLNRETSRLSQIQDISGYRIVVEDVFMQNDVVSKLEEIFDLVDVVDRRERSSNGYRAVHVIPYVEGKPFEIQIRSKLQHYWAELSEKIADKVGIDVKYGGGPVEARETLSELSDTIKSVENVELQLKQKRLWEPEDLRWIEFEEQNFNIPPEFYARKRVDG